MNRMRFIALCVAVSLGCFGVAFGIDLTDPGKAPATYVKMVKQGDKTVPVFDDTTHWFSAKTFDQVMALYGCTLKEPSKVPATYAKVVKKDGKESIVFDETAAMYSPSSLNRILSAYGLTLTDPSKPWSVATCRGSGSRMQSCPFAACAALSWGALLLLWLVVGTWDGNEVLYTPTCRGKTRQGKSSVPRLVQLDLRHSRFSVICRRSAVANTAGALHPC
jgi:hypothetical protein